MQKGQFGVPPISCASAAEYHKNIQAPRPPPRPRWWAFGGLEARARLTTGGWRRVDGRGELAPNGCAMMKIVVAAGLLIAVNATAWAGPADCPKWMRKFLTHQAPLNEAFEAFDRRDCPSALRLFQVDAERGNAAAQNNVGVIYEAGLSVDPDDRVAERWYRRAADQGLADAQFNLAVLLATRRPKTWGDVASSMSEFEREVKSKDAATLAAFVEAYMWLSLAAKGENAMARPSMERLGGRMTPTQIAEAQRLAREWWAKHGK